MSMLFSLFSQRLVGEENEPPFISVWKPFPSRRVLKTLREIPKMTIFASGGPEPLQMVSEPDDVPARRLFPEGVDTRQCVSKDAGP